MARRTKGTPVEERLEETAGKLAKGEREGTGTIDDGNGTKAPAKAKLAGKKIYRVTITGITPLLTNPETPQLLDELDKTAATRTPKDATIKPRDKAEARLIRDEQGRFGIPKKYLFANWRDAGNYVKFDTKNNVSTKELTRVKFFLKILDVFMPFKEQAPNWLVDRRKGNLPKDGTAVCITRPLWPDWEFDVLIEINWDRTAPEKVLDIFEYGGCLGLGDHRKKGDFGMYKVSKIEFIRDVIPDAAAVGF